MNIGECGDICLILREKSGDEVHRHYAKWNAPISRAFRLPFTRRLVPDWTNPQTGEREPRWHVRLLRFYFRLRPLWASKTRIPRPELIVDTIMWPEGG